MPKRWLRNWRVKLGTVVAASLLMLGFYALIQANPLSGSTAAANAASVPTTATSDVSSSGQAPKAQPTPRPAPVRRARVSRGS